MPKTIVICSDGTGNSDTGRVPSNVKRLFDFLAREPGRQVSIYDPGVGTEPRQPDESRTGYWRQHLAELCFGEGVAANLLELYTYLVDQYKPGDRVFLFGFSRGAFTVRALAGLVHVCGLLRHDQIRRTSEAVRLYEGSEQRIIQRRNDLGLPPKFPPDETDHGAFDLEADAFKRLHGQPCQVHFLGIWDTVKAYGWLSPRSFPALRHNPSVQRVRHAAALDERRALFQMTGWGDRHPQVKEVWFAGDHADVGGGHDDGNSALTDASLVWMLGEATREGLALDPAKRCEIRQILHHSAEAATTPAKDLWIKQGFVALDLTPRVELGNAVYPPERRKRVLWLDGARKPGDHDFGGQVFVHHTVDARLRAGDQAYGRAKLTRATESGKTIHLHVARDLEIR
jgi:uncharacterized protein (DUF2235 family)